MKNEADRFEVSKIRFSVEQITLIRVHILHKYTSVSQYCSHFKDKYGTYFST